MYDALVCSLCWLGMAARGLTHPHRHRNGNSSGPSSTATTRSPGGQTPSPPKSARGRRSYVPPSFIRSTSPCSPAAPTQAVQNGWKANLAAGAPKPETFWVSPLTRTANTMRLSFGELLEGETPVFVEVRGGGPAGAERGSRGAIRACARFMASTRAISGEARWVDGCDGLRRRAEESSMQSYLKERFPDYTFEEGFAEDDPWWKAGGWRPNLPQGNELISMVPARQTSASKKSTGGAACGNSWTSCLTRMTRRVSPRTGSGGPRPSADLWPHGRCLAHVALVRDPLHDGDRQPRGHCARDGRDDSVYRPGDAAAAMTGGAVDATRGTSRVLLNSRTRAYARHHVRRQQRAHRHGRTPFA